MAINVHHHSVRICNASRIMMQMISALIVTTKAATYALVLDSLRSSDKSIVLVVSPLTALMIEQKHKYASLGMAVEFVGEA